MNTVITMTCTLFLKRARVTPLTYQKYYSQPFDSELIKEERVLLAGASVLNATRYSPVLTAAQVLDRD